MTEAKKSSITRAVLTFACVPCCYDENGCDISHALVTLTEHFVEELLNRIQLAKALKGLMPHFCHIEEFDYSIEYVDSEKLRSEEGESSELDAVTDAWMELDDPPNIPEEKMERVEAATLVAQPDGSVRWDAFVRGTNTRVSTPYFSEETLKLLLTRIRSLQGGK
jgi:hypothetical protein